MDDLDILQVEEADQAEQYTLSDEDLGALCESEYENGEYASEIYEAQKLALRQYHLKNDGNEVEGQSQVQSSDVRDAVESALPILLDMFMSSESPVVFRPSGADDLDQADQETVFCQHVLHTQNPGLLIVHAWWKDALLFKNGYVKVYWDGKTEQEREDYDGLLEDELASLMADDDYEIIDVHSLPEVIEAQAYSVKGFRKSDAGQVRIVNIPPDRVRVSAGWANVDTTESPYVCHGPEPVTKSQLVIEGYDPAIVMDLPTSQGTDQGDRSFLDLNAANDNDATGSGSTQDWTRDVVDRYEHYIRADRNGDGVAELLQVVRIGSNGGTILSIEEVDASGIYAATGYPIPHSHLGMSLADFVGETQKIKTAVLRQTLDNLYLSNLPGLAVDATNITNPDVLAGPRAGMILLKRSPNPVAEPLAVPFTAANSLTVLQEIDAMAERKTGLSPESTGLDATALAEANIVNGQSFMNQAQLRMKLMSSMLVETGLKPVMLRIRELVMKHMSREEMVQLGGRWVPINPRNWREKRNTQLRIGVGTVQKQERVATLQTIMTLQQSIVAQQGGINGPFVTPDNIYNSLNEMERLTGHFSVDRYFSNPKDWTPPPEKPDVASEALEIEQAKLTVDAQNKATELELKARELAIKEREVSIKENELHIKREDLAAKRQDAKEQRMMDSFHRDADRQAKTYSEAQRSPRPQDAGE